MTRSRVFGGVAAGITVALVLSACGSKVDAGGTSSATGSATGAAVAAGKTCTDTSGSTIKVGSLNSLSGTMAISEVTVRERHPLAVDEINAGGGVLGKQIQIVGEDGASEPDGVRREGREADQQRLRRSGLRRLDVSSSRKAMLPVFESNNSLLYYPVQYEGLESCKNIFYTGATTNQQIVPALDYLKEKGVKSLLPGRQRLRLPADRQPDHQGLRRGQRHRDQGRGLHPAGLRPDFSTIVNKVRTPTPARCSTPSTATPTSRSSRSTRTSA